MPIVRYKITLEEPVLVTTMSGGDPNSAVAFDYLPGSALRGYVIGRVTNRLGNFNNGDDGKRFFDNSIRFLNGYPLYDTQRGWPTPLSWRKPKNKDVIKDILYKKDGANNNQSNSQNDNVDEQLERVKKPFWAWHEHQDKEDEVNLWKPKRYLDVHNARNRRYGRAVPNNANLLEGEESGAVYRYDALARGQEFEAAVVCNNANDAHYVAEKFDRYPNAKLGGARSAGYGRVRIDVVEVVDDDLAWLETGQHVANYTVHNSEEFVLTLFSDMLVRDEYGQHVADGKAVARAIERQLQSENEELKLGLDLIKSYDSPTMIGGFNRTWGLPLPQTVAIGMGSVYKFVLNANVTQIELDSLVRDGIGERRADGFGRVAINWHYEWSAAPINIHQPKRSDQPSDARPTPLKTEAEIRLAQQMGKRILRQQLDGWVREQALKATFKNIPRSSQISQLRSVVQTELQKVEPSTSVIENFLKKVQKRQVARQQFERCQITLRVPSEDKKKDKEETLRFDTWLRSPLEVFEGKDFDAYVEIGEVNVNADALTDERILGLVDSVCDYMMKQKREE